MAERPAVAGEVLHSEGWAVWDGREVLASYYGPHSQATAEKKREELEDAGATYLTLWKQRTCAWVATTVRSNPDHVTAIEAGGATVLAYERRLAQIADVHLPGGGDGRCRTCNTGWPCQTYRLATDPIRPL